MVTDIRVQEAYAARAAEYTALFGSADAAHESDRLLISRWAQSLRGPAVDAGCGPGHWTAYLANHGIEVEGTDLVPLFIEKARTRFPGTRFRVAALRAFRSSERTPGRHPRLVFVDPSFASRIAPCSWRVCPLHKPEGSVLLGFFDGPAGEPFPHAVTTAYYWSVDAMSQHLLAAGFCVQEIDVRTDPESRPHTAIVAVRTTPYDQQRDGDSNLPERSHMAHAENEVTINRTASEVYAFLADGLNNPNWRSGVQCIALKEGTAGESGAIYSQTLTGPKGRPLQGNYKITDAEPGRLLGFQVVAGPARTRSAGTGTGGERQRYPGPFQP